jgi:hypothetical protein
MTPAGFELMDDSENFLNDLDDSELDIMGGAVQSWCFSLGGCCFTRAE